MSEPTLADEQREGEPILLAAARRMAEREPSRHIRIVAGTGTTVRGFVAEVDEWVAAMLADERAAREAAEAKVRDLTAGIGALADSLTVPGATEPCDGAESCCGSESHCIAMQTGFKVIGPPELRALVDDPVAALAEVRPSCGYCAGVGPCCRDNRAEAEAAGR